MRDVWGSKFTSQAKEESNKDNINIKIDTLNSSPTKSNTSLSPDKPKTILRDISKLKESNQTTNITNTFPNKLPEKKIDKEHVALEKIFKICLVEKENFQFLKDYATGLEERKLEKAFRVNDLDSIIISVITSNEKVYIYFTFRRMLYFHIYLRLITEPMR